MNPIREYRRQQAATNRWRRLMRLNEQSRRDKTDVLAWGIYLALWTAVFIQAMYS